MALSYTIFNREQNLSSNTSATVKFKIRNLKLFIVNVKQQTQTRDYVRVINYIIHKLVKKYSKSQECI